jgi:hypothetical protein
MRARARTHTHTHSHTHTLARSLTRAHTNARARTHTRTHSLSHTHIYTHAHVVCDVHTFALRLTTSSQDARGSLILSFTNCSSKLTLPVVTSEAVREASLNKHPLTYTFNSTQANLPASLPCWFLVVDSLAGNQGSRVSQVQFPGRSA